MSAKRFLVLALLGLIVPAGCSSASGTPAVLTRALPQSGSPSQYISHVVVIVQENRTFENFFTGYPGANAPPSGCAIPEGRVRPTITSTRRAPRREFGLPPRRYLGCAPTDHFRLCPDLGHDWQTSQTDYDKGKMDGFSKFHGELWPISGVFVRRAVSDQTVLGHRAAVRTRR